MKNRHLLVVFVLTITVTAPSAFAGIQPISDIPAETVQGWRSSPPYGWTYAFDIGFADLEIYVELRIGLTGDDPGANLISVWENGIEGMWSRQFDIIEGDFHYHVNFDAVLNYDILPSAHHVVTVTEGTGSGNMLNWYTTSAWGEQYNGPYVAHEVGHMFSLFDEYEGGAVDPINPIIDYGSIMGSLAAPAKQRHYEPFRGWLQAMEPDRELIIGDYDPDWVIPEPCTVLLMALAMLIALNRRPTH